MNEILKQFPVGTKVRVMDPESPWVGRSGEVIGANVDLLLVRFSESSNRIHDRYLAVRQIKAESFRAGSMPEVTR